MALWDDVKKNLVEWYTLTSEKTTEAARIGSRRWDKFGISRDIERQFSELGSLVYNGLKEEREDLLAGEEIQDLVRRIENLEEELQRKNQEIEDIREEYRREKHRAQSAAASGAEDPAAGPGAESSAGADGTEDAGEFPAGVDGVQADPAAAAQEESPNIITDPILDHGGEDSAILVEPEEEDSPGEDPGDDLGDDSDEEPIEERPEDDSRDKKD